VSIGLEFTSKIRRLLQLEWEVEIQHIYREANGCADALAKMRCLLGSNMIFSESCLTQLSSLFYVELNKQQILIA
jgi:hypothetical protein